MGGMARIGLLTQTLGAWLRIVEEIRAGKARLDQGMSLAMKNIFGNETALKTLCVFEWLKAIKDEIRRRQQIDMEAARKLLEMARQRAINMLSKKSIDANLLPRSWDGWRTEVLNGQLGR